MLKRNFTVLRFALVLGLISTAAFAQSKPAGPALPSEDTVNGFMKYTFGFDPGTTWKILKIQPSPYGMAEVNVQVAQKDQPPTGYRLLIAPDGEHVVVGDVIPFGAKPYAPARKLLDAGAKGLPKAPLPALSRLSSSATSSVLTARKPNRPSKNCWRRIRISSLCFKIFPSPCTTGHAKRRAMRIV